MKKLWSNTAKELRESVSIPTLVQAVVGLGSVHDRGARLVRELQDPDSALATEHDQDVAAGYRPSWSR